MSASAGRVLLLFKGEYDGSATYAPMDVVKYGVSSFVCKQESMGNLPTNTTYWQVLAQGISNMSPEAIGIGYGVSSDSGSARTATLSDYNLTPNGIVAVTFGADVPANATLNINSQGAKPIYFRGSAIVANVIKGGDTVTFAYDGTHYDILCIDGGAGHKIINSAGTELTQRDGLQFTDGLEATDDSTNQRTKVGMNLPIVPRATWDAMTEQEKTAYIASHYRFGIELPNTEGVINAEYMKLLWENPNTTQAFAGQTITLNSADYDLLLIVANYVNSSSNSIPSVICAKGNSCLMSVGVGTSAGARVFNRPVTRVSDTSYSFGDCNFATGSTAASIVNTYIIPVAIYGIKASFQFKVNAIASELSTRADHCFLDDETTTVEDAIATYPQLTLLATQNGTAEKSVDLSDTNCDYVFVLEDNTGNAVKNIHTIHGSLIESTVKTIHNGAYFTSSDNEGYVIGYKKDSMRLYQYYKNGSNVGSGCTLSVYKKKFIGA